MSELPAIPERTVEDFFDHEYRDFAIYTGSKRAIPSLVDGFKPSQRKIAFAADKLWRGGSEGKPMKVFQLGGQAAAMSFYHHGSLDDTIIGMTQEFKNSLPIFQGVGQFGSLRAPEPGAARYIGVKFNSNFRLLYKDFDLVTPQAEEGQPIEPLFFLPILPTVLLNGSSGMAVGFSTNILNRKPSDLVDACVEVLRTGRVSQPLVPWMNGFYGTVEPKKDTDKTWVFRGLFEVKNTSTVEVTEIPPSLTYEKYEAHLEALIEKGVLASYEDSSSDRVRYQLKFARATLADLIARDKLSDLLKMREQETENITTLDENGKLKIFDKAEDLVVYFVNFRLGYYVKRKQHLLAEIAEEIAVLEARASFVKAITEGTIVVAGAKKADLVKGIAELGLQKHEGSYDFLLTMPVYTLTAEKHAELLKKIEERKREQTRLLNATPESTFLADLAELRKELTKNSGGTPPAPPVGKKAPSCAAPEPLTGVAALRAASKLPRSVPVVQAEAVKPPEPEPPKVIPPEVAKPKEKPAELDLLSMFG